MIDTGNWYIRRKADDLWFTGFAEDNTPQFGTANEAKPYASKLEAEVQAEWLPVGTQVSLSDST